MAEVHHTNDKAHATEKAPERKKLTVKGKADPFTVEARGVYDTMVGELLPGESGFLTLDAAGTPTGSATLLPPAGGVSTIRVAANSSPISDVLTTTTGASLHEAMNAHPDPRAVLPPPPPPEGDTLSTKKTVSK